MDLHCVRESLAYRCAMGIYPVNDGGDALKSKVPGELGASLWKPDLLFSNYRQQAQALGATHMLKNPGAGRVDLD